MARTLDRAENFVRDELTRLGIARSRYVLTPRRLDLVTPDGLATLDLRQLAGETATAALARIEKHLHHSLGHEQEAADGCVSSQL